jgi:NAD(P)-dependent dehydrogenase (short-subunit alcohol dehydrogenase family)
MSQRTWFITGVSSGFGRHLTEQLLQRGDKVIGTVRDTSKVSDLVERYPDSFYGEVLELTDTAAIRKMVDDSFARFGRIDVIISNAGFGLFGAAEELKDSQVEQIVATNLVGPIHLIRAALPHLRAQKGGHVIQISSYGGQVAFAGNSLYHATKWGVEGFVESVAQEVAAFGIGMTIEPGGARTEFRYGSAQVAELMPVAGWSKTTGTSDRLRREISGWAGDSAGPVRRQSSRRCYIRLRGSQGHRYQVHLGRQWVFEAPTLISS